MNKQISDMLIIFAIQIMSLNTTTNGEPIQTIYVYRSDRYYYEGGRGFDIPHVQGYSASLYKPDIVDGNKLIEVIKVDTTRMTARPIDDYFHKILFIWNDEEFKQKYNEWKEWIKQYETN